MENAENGEVGGKVMIGAPFAGNEKRFSYTEEQKKLVIGRQVPPHTREDDLRYFWTVAEARGLDPFCDYLYGEYEDEPTGGWNFRVHPTLAGYRFKAEETGEYRGTTTPEFCGDDGQWTEAWLKQEPPAACKVGVKRKEFTEPQYHIVLMKDWVQLMEVNPYWKLSPEMSLAARAETGALKKAFPSLGGGVTMEERLDPRLIKEVTQGMKACRDIPITRTEETSPDADSTASKPEVAKQGGPNGENSPTKADVGTGGRRVRWGGIRRRDPLREKGTSGQYVWHDKIRAVSEPGSKIWGGQRGKQRNVEIGPSSDPYRVASGGRCAEGNSASLL